jgi:hypothetical protein
VHKLAVAAGIHRRMRRNLVSLVETASKRSKLLDTPVHIALLAAVIVPLLLQGCAKPPMTNMWKDPSYSEGALKKVLVIAVRNDPVRRRIWEDSFVKELSKHGVPAVSSYALFPAVAPDTQQVTQAVRENAFDGVCASRTSPTRRTFLVTSSGSPFSCPVRSPTHSPHTGERWKYPVIRTRPRCAVSEPTCGQL